MFSALPPVITAIYSGGKHSETIFSITALVTGEYALGFTIAVFPAAMASASGSILKRNGYSDVTDIGGINGYRGKIER